MFGKSELEKKVSSMTVRIDELVSRVNAFNDAINDAIIELYQRTGELEASQQFPINPMEKAIDIPVVTSDQLKDFSPEAHAHVYYWVYKTKGSYKGIASDQNVSHHMRDCMQQKRAKNTNSRKEFLKACEHFGIK